MNRLPKWIEKRYLTLYRYFGTNPFTFSQAFEVLNKEYEDSQDQVKVIMSEIKKAELVKVERSQEDEREKRYTLISSLISLLKRNQEDEREKRSSIIVNQISTKDQLISLLKQAADIIRTRVDYTFILLLLFYKSYSEKWEKEFIQKKEELIKKGWAESEAVAEAETPYYHTFNFPREYLWDNLRKDPQKISEKFSIAMKKLAELNPNYQDIFSQFDFHQFTSNPENSVILNQLVELFSKFSFADISSDILGDAYEWILKYFAPTKAKEGEVYTPREVIRLMIEILDPKPRSSIYDPAVGSGGMLILAYKYIEEKYGRNEADLLFLYGQEANSKTLALAKMNMLMHDIRNFYLMLGDTLLFPKFKENNFIKQFDYVIANPPWNQDGYNGSILSKGEYWNKRFEYGFATKNSADWIWIQHMLASAKDSSGKVAVVIDTGAVSRGGKEKLIREKIVSKDLIESIILLPEKLFYNTGAPAVIIIFNKNKLEERKGKILLINASQEFEAGKNQNTLTTENISKIVRVYREFKEINGFSRIISIQEAKSENYNLSPSRFVIVTEEEKYRDIEEIQSDIYELQKEEIEITQKLEMFLKKLIN